MNNRAVFLSLVMSLIAVFFVWSYVDSVETEAKKKFGTEVLVVKAKRDIKEQETVKDSMLELEVVPKRFLEPSAVSFEKRDEDKEQTSAKVMKNLTGTVAVVPIRKGEQITYNKITEPGIRTGLAPQVAPGRRAVAIPVNEISGVAKLVKPGDRVDIIVVLDMGGGKENRMSKTFLQDVVVLSVGKNITNNVARIVEVDPFSGKEKPRSLNEDSSFASVTLEVEPSQAQALALVLANPENSMMLSLRNNDDTDRLNNGPTTLGDVLGSDAARMGARVPANQMGGVRR